MGRGGRLAASKIESREPNHKEGKHTGREIPTIVHKVLSFLVYFFLERFADAASYVLKVLFHGFSDSAPFFGPCSIVWICLPCVFFGTLLKPCPLSLSPFSPNYFATFELVSSVHCFGGSLYLRKISRTPGGGLYVWDVLFCEGGGGGTHGCIL